jgi:hypothetical protein
MPHPHKTRMGHPQEKKKMQDQEKADFIAPKARDPGA